MILKGKGWNWKCERERERNGDVCSDWGNSAIPVLLLAMDKSAVMGWTVWEGKRPIKGDGKRVPFVEAGLVFVTSSVSYNYLSWPPPLYFWPLFLFGQFLNFRSALSLSLSLSHILFFISSLHPKLMYIYDMALGKKKCCDLAWIHKPFLPATNSQNGTEQMFRLSLNCPCNSFRNCFYIF